MKNINNIDDYPTDYNWLPIEDQQKILKIMNTRQKLADQYWQICKDSYIESESYDVNLDEYMYTISTIMDKDINEKLYLYNAAINFISGARIAYASLGIMVEYNWPNHKGEWFLATASDASAYENSQEEEEIDQPVLQNILLHYGDVGI